jgi:hypothetical protein
MKKRRSPVSNAQYQGIAIALAELARAHMEPDLAVMVLQSLDLSVADLETAGADPYDLAEIKKAVRL